MDYARQRAEEILRLTGRVILITSGPAGVQASECTCEIHGVEIYLFVPRTSDHLFNLEVEPLVMVLSGRWMAKGSAALPERNPSDLEIAKTADAEWCQLVRVWPDQIQIPRADGWGSIESIDLRMDESVKKA